MHLSGSGLTWTSSTVQDHNSPFPVSPMISLMVLLGDWLKTVKISTTSVGLNHKVDGTCPALTHNLGHDEPHFLVTKSYKKADKKSFAVQTKSSYKVHNKETIHRMLKQVYYNIHSYINPTHMYYSPPTAV